MAYNSAHTGAEIDAAVEMLGQVQSARDATRNDLVEVQQLASQVAADADQVADQAATVGTKSDQVQANADAVEQARNAVVAAAEVAEESKDAAVLAATSAQGNQEAANASELAAAQSQVAAGLSEQVSAEHAETSVAAALQAEADRAIAQQSAESAARSAENAEAVVTGGTATSTSSPGKIPLADADGKIDSEWLGPDIARAQDVQAATEAAEAAEEKAEAVASRTGGFLVPVAQPPLLRDDATPLQVGDRYFNTQEHAEYIYTAAGWEANDSQQSIADIANEADPAKGASLVGFDGAQLDALLVNAKSLPDYTALQAYAGQATGITITNPGIFGHFYRDPSVTVGDRGTKFIDALGRGWRRRFTGNVNTAWFGSRGDYLISGIFDDAAFSDAAKAAPAVNNISGPAGTTTMPRAPICFIDVPDGTYGFQSTIDVGNKEVTWVFSSAARIQGDTQKKLNGNIVRQGERITKQAYGTHGYATGFSVAVDAEEFDKSPAVTGITSASAFNAIPSHDSVGLFVGNYSKAALHKTTAPCTFTANTVTLPEALSADQLLKLRRGMTVDTLHNPRWVGLLDSWSPDGLTLTVTGWYLYGGSGASTPPNTAGVGIGGNDRAWGMNTALRLNADGYAYQGIGWELSVYNYIGSSGSNLDIDQGRIWGQLLATGGGDSYFCQAASIAKGNWIYGYVAHTDPKVGFYARSNATVGFLYHGGGDALIVEDNAYSPQITLKSTGQVVFGNDTQVVSGGRFIDFKTSGTGLAYDGRISVKQGGVSLGQALWEFYGYSFTFSGHILPSSDATKDLGSSALGFNSIYGSVARLKSQLIIGLDTVSSSSRIIDFKTSGASLTYDSRIIAGGGGGTVGSGNMQIMAADLSTSATLRPTGDNSKNLGSASNRWGTVYSGTGTINTSDERMKDEIEDIPDEVLDAWSEVKYQQYRFRDAIDEKGSAARLHIGLVAQRVQEAFERNSIDPFAYGILCHDEWEEVVEVLESSPEVLDADGAVMEDAQTFVVTAARKAGDRYSIRYDEALALEAALMRRTWTRMELQLQNLLNQKG